MNVLSKDKALEILKTVPVIILPGSSYGQLKKAIHTLLDLLEKQEELIKRLRERLDKRNSEVENCKIDLKEDKNNGY